MDRAISPFEAQKLFKYAYVADPGVTTPERLQKIMDTIKINIGEMGSQGFTKKAMDDNTTREYIWARTTAPGIIWLWGQQDKDTRVALLENPTFNWQNNKLSPSPDAPLDEGFTPSVTTSPSASRASGSAAGVSVERGLSVSVAPPERTAHFDQPAYPPISPGGGYRKRRTRKTRRKSNRRGKSRSRSRSRQIRRKKTHHRRHRR